MGRFVDGHLNQVVTITDSAVYDFVETMRGNFFERYPAAPAVQSANIRGMMALVALLALIPYLKVLGNAFINLDDQLFVTQNYHVRAGLNLQTLTWALRATIAANWHPLTTLSHALDCTIYGVRPWGHHATSLLLHSLNSVLLFLLLFRASGERSQSLLVAALFAVHPFNVETVAWIASRKGLLSTFFAFLALIAYTRYAHAPALKRYLAVVGLMIMALLAKPMVVTLPFLMLLLDYWPLRRITAPVAKHFLVLVQEKLPLFVLAFASSGLTYLVHFEERSFHSYSLQARLANALSSYLTYVAKTIWPSGLCIYYPHPGEQINWLMAAAGGALILGVIALAFRFAISWPPLIFGWFWFLGTLVPVSGLVPIDGNSMADRYAYIPLIGLFVIFAFGTSHIGQSKPAWARTLNGAVVILVVALAVRTWDQTGYWRNSRAVFEHALSVTGDNGLAQAALGDALLQEGKLQAAVDRLTRAAETEPALSDALNSLGVALLRLHRTDEAVQRLQEAVKQAPRMAIYRCNLADALLQQGQVDAAYRQYQAAAELDENLPYAHVQIGWIELGRNRPQAALAALEKAVVANPNDADAQHRLGVVLARQGRLQEAAEHLLRAVRLGPGVEPRFNCGMALLNLGRLGEAESLFRQVLAEQPGHLGARSQLGLCLGLEGRVKEAIKELRVALTANPEDAASLYHLAVALALEGRIEEAVAAAERAFAIDPNQPNLKETLDRMRRDLAAARKR
jgi:tetratricopeptide (TPR) repeat protein